MNTRALVAELVGTFLFVFVGVMVVISGFYPENSTGNLVSIALGHGIAIAVLATALGSISGGHFNPAVSFGLAMAGKLSVRDLVGYWIAQVIGGIAGAWVAIFCVGPAAPVDSNGGVPSVGTYIDPGQAMMMEMLGTLILVLVVFGTAVSKKAPKMGALSIGLSITAVICAIGPFTGAAINPIRWLGPALVSGKLSNSSAMTASPLYGSTTMMMIYIVGPLLGAFVAAVLFKYLFAGEKESSTG